MGILRATWHQKDVLMSLDILSSTRDMFLEMDMLRNIRSRKDAFLKDTFLNLRGQGLEFPPTSGVSLS